MMDRRVLLATKNQGKLKEFRRIVAELHGEDSIELLSAEDFPHLGDIEETGATFIENALLKARESCRITGVAAIADTLPRCGAAQERPQGAALRSGKSTTLGHSPSSDRSRSGFHAS
jgi:hypothetical protein